MTNVARRTTTGCLLATLALVCLLAVASSAVAADRSQHYRLPGGGTLTVPASSLTRGARVVVARAAAPRTTAPLRSIGVPVSLRVIHGRLKGPATLTLRYRGRIRTRGLPSTLTVYLGYWDARARRWRTLPARLNTRRHTVTAVIRHFSWWNPLSWDWDSIILRADQRIGELRGARTAPAKCTSGVPVPSWADTVTDNGADLQLRTCAEGQDGKVVVQIVNNRPYGMVLHYGAPVAWGWHETPDDAATGVAAAVMDQLVTPDELYLPPLKAASVGVPEGTWWFAPFQAQPTPQTIFTDVLALVADQIDVKLIRPGLFSELAAACSEQLKPTFDGGVTIEKDPLGWVQTVSDCVLKALPVAAAHSKLDGVTLDQLEHATSLLSHISVAAEGTKLAADIEDLIVGTLPSVQGNASFSIRRRGNTGSGNGQPPGAPPSSGQQGTTTQPTPPQPTRVNAYDNYGEPATGRAMCRGNPGNGQSMPGGTAAETFTVPASVASLDTALVQIDPDSTVTAHATLSVNGAARATADVAAGGDTTFHFTPVAVNQGDQVTLSINFTASYGKIITVYTVGSPGGTFTASNSCPAGAPSLTTSSTGLRAVLSGWSH